MMFGANQDRNHLTSDSCLSGREGLLPRNDRGGGRAAQARGPGQKEDDYRILVARSRALDPGPDARGIINHSKANVQFLPSHL